MTRAAGLAAALLLMGRTAGAAPAATITVAQAHAAIDEIGRLVAKDYVLPEKRAGIVAELRKREAAGRYDITDASLFAQTVGDDMIAISHDRHMWFTFDPDGFRDAQRPHTTDYTDAFSDAAAARDNQGYTEMRILPGNLRYVNLTGFEWSRAATTKAVADVARFLAGGDAIIIDISGNGGGSPQSVQALVSYLLPPDGRTLMTFHDGPTGKTNSTHALKHLDGPRLTGRPLYVLINGRTGSAADEFAYHIRNFKLGALVGSTTAGAANNDTVFPVQPFFVQSISTGRVVHPVTNTNWEHVGVSPDITAAPDQALAEAEVVALKALEANGSADHRQDYDWALVAAQAELNPVHLDDAALAAYAGQYGDRKVWMDHGSLVFQRAGREPTRLSPLSDDLFEFGNTANVRAHFRKVDGRVTGLDMITPDGHVLPLDRTA
jgi:hypothetical protein